MATTSNQSIIGDILNVTKDVAKLVSEVTTSSNQLIDQGIAGINKITQTLITDTTNTLVDVTKDILSVDVNSTVDTAKLLYQANSILDNAKVELLSDINDKILKVGDGVKELSREAIKSITNYIPNALKNGGLNGVENEIKNEFKTFIDKVKAKSSLLIKETNEDIIKFKNNILVQTSALKSEFYKSIEAEGNSLKEINDKVVKFPNEEYNKIRTELINHSNELNNTINTYINTIGNTVTDTIHDTFITTQDIINIIKDTANTIYDKVNGKETIAPDYQPSLDLNNTLTTSSTPIYNKAETLALLNQQGYADSTTDSLPKGFRMLEDEDYSSGYHVRVFINDTTHEIVVSHRGSQDSSPVQFCLDWIMADGRIALGDGPKAQMKDALSYNDELQKKISSKYPNYTVIQTGHSLGGYIAQVIGAKNGQETVTFDAPGAKDYIVESHFTNYEKNIVNIIGPNDLINQAGTQPGSVIQIAPSDVKYNPAWLVGDITVLSGVDDARAYKLFNNIFYDYLRYGKDYVINELSKYKKLSIEEINRFIATMNSNQSLLQNTYNWHGLDNYINYFKNPANVPVKVINKSSRTDDQLLYGDIDGGKLGNSSPAKKIVESTKKNKVKLSYSKQNKIVPKSAKALQSSNTYGGNWTKKY